MTGWTATRGLDAPITLAAPPSLAQTHGVKPLQIDLVSDVVCPWCFIGTRNLEAAVASMGIETDLTFRPFLLDPATPPGGEDLRERLRRKYGGDPGQMFARVEQAARNGGLELDFSRVRLACSTVDAHTLLRHAVDLGTQRALAGALFAAYFQEGRDIGDQAVLAELAGAHGFEPASVAPLFDEAERARTRAEARAMAEQGISGVPFFIFDRRLAVSGAQPAAVLEGAMKQALAAR